MKELLTQPIILVPLAFALVIGMEGCMQYRHCRNNLFKPSAEQCINYILTGELK